MLMIENRTTEDLPNCQDAPLRLQFRCDDTTSEPFSLRWVLLLAEPPW